VTEPPIVCLIATWRDGELLADAVRSARPHVGQVVVLDGGYEGVVSRGEASSTLADLAPAMAAGALVFENPPGYLWPGEIEKRNVLLELGRAAIGVGVDVAEAWALVLDADEVLVNGDLLRVGLDAFPGHAVPLLRREPDGRMWAAPSRLFLLSETVRYSGRSYWLTYDPDHPMAVDLSHWEATDPPPSVRSVIVEHRWDRREPWRREVQERWGRLLAKRDGHS
jgi:hypothetical protein